MVLPSPCPLPARFFWSCFGSRSRLQLQPHSDLYLHPPALDGEHYRARFLGVWRGRNNAHHRPAKKVRSRRGWQKRKEHRQADRQIGGLTRDVLAACCGRLRTALRARLSLGHTRADGRPEGRLRAPERGQARGCRSHPCQPGHRPAEPVRSAHRAGPEPVSDDQY